MYGSQDDYHLRGGVEAGREMSIETRVECAFCGAEMVPAQTPPQHIVPEGLGGTLTTRVTTCGLCNKWFGDSIESAFCRRYHRVTNVLAPMLGANLRPPTVETRTDFGERIRLRPGGAPESAKATWSKDGKICFAPSMEAARRLIRNGPWPNPKLTYIREEVLGTAIDPSPMYADEYVRCAAKILLEYLVHAIRVEKRDLGRAPAACPPLTDAIDFVRTGQYNDRIVFRPHLYPHRRGVVNSLFTEHGAPESRFCHRLFIVFDSDQACVWGGILRVWSHS